MGMERMDFLLSMDICPVTSSRGKTDITSMEAIFKYPVQFEVRCLIAGLLRNYPDDLLPGNRTSPQDKGFRFGAVQYRGIYPSR